MALLADLVEPAKSTALEKLGLGERAMRIATDWLRAKMTAQATCPSLSSKSLAGMASASSTVRR